jgi:hypothetical protein
MTLIDKLAEGIYDVMSSLNQSPRARLVIKLEKLDWTREMLMGILPEDFDKKGFEPIKRHLHFMEYYYSKDRDYSMLKSNADDLLKNDLPALRKDLTVFFGQDYLKQKRTPQKSDESMLPQLASDIGSNLRRLVREHPDNEKKIQDHLEDLLALMGYKFEREQVSIPYSTKSYKPDFTSEELNTAIDVKLCNTPADEKNIIDEINADILGYKQRYKNLLFVVYDMAVIRKIREYILDIEKSNPNVTVLVIKH